MTIRFSKYHASGNDFIIIDNRNGHFNNECSELVKLMCGRRTGIGADGLILLQNSPGFAFKMLYYNSDGFDGSMCGNGGKCVFLYAFELGITGNSADFLSSDGIHSAFAEDNNVFLKMKDVREIRQMGGGYFLDTGSPHFVKYVTSPHGSDIKAEGREIRNRKEFLPGGVNVNFIEVMAGNCIEIATYERGVEDETLSCGTGSVAAAVVAALNFGDGSCNFDILAKGGRNGVKLTKEKGIYKDIWLSGVVHKVFDGEYYL